MPAHSKLICEKGYNAKNMLHVGKGRYWVYEKTSVGLNQTKVEQSLDLLFLKLKFIVLLIVPHRKDSRVLLTCTFVVNNS